MHSSLYFSRVPAAKNMQHHERALEPIMSGGFMLQWYTFGLIYALFSTTVGVQDRLLKEVCYVCC